MNENGHNLTNKYESVDENGHNLTNKYESVNENGHNLTNKEESVDEKKKLILTTSSPACQSHTKEKHCQ